MSVKSATLYVRIEPSIKEQAEGILSALGIPASNAINMFYKQIILHKGLPFDVKIPPKAIVDIGRLSESEVGLEIQKGYDDVKSGKTRLANDVFAGIYKDYEMRS